jgi:adenylate kinase family enzyme
VPGVQRVLVAGITGAGKTTFARDLAARTGLPFHEIDALYHGPGWQPLPSFVDDVGRIAAGERWVFDSYGYQQVRDLLWSRADTVVWLDFSRRVVMTRVLRRSFDRAWHRREIFNGNTEDFRAWLDPEHPVQWAWTEYAARRRDLEARFADPAHAAIAKAHLRTPAAARRWLGAVAG